MLEVEITTGQPLRLKDIPVGSVFRVVTDKMVIEE